MDNTKTYFFKDKPLFGLDVGHSSVKVMQLRPHGRRFEVLGYGVGGFDTAMVKEGEIIDHEGLAKSIGELFEKNLIGTISTKRVAMNIPAARAFSRTMNLPALAESELAEAVKLEVEQYIPVPLSDLYLDYTVISHNEQGVELLVVAAPQRIVDSLMAVAYVLGLEPIGLDMSIGAAGRMFERQGDNNDIPAVLVDFGSLSADITVHDQTSIVSGTVPCGGETITDVIAKKLKVSQEEANLIKSKYGVGKSKKQAEILSVVKPELDKIAKEIKRMIRYYEERASGTKKIGQIITMGGGANTPGLNDILTETLRLPVRMCDPWYNLYLHKLSPPSPLEKSMYVTVAGLSMIEPKELFS